MDKKKYEYCRKHRLYYYKERDLPGCPACYYQGRYTYQIECNKSYLFHWNKSEQDYLRIKKALKRLFPKKIDRICLELERYLKSINEIKELQEEICTQTK